ncbi:hypothetical protein DXG01_006324 [Tephrocybe rancida]|nr:hypothetical protein DXG01_006324 [Tephrocybe rancida]
MTSTFKRVLTDELRDSLAASILSMMTSLPVFGVTEGYMTVPPSFSKSNSTGTIFQSARDTLREAQGLHLAVHSTDASQRKRSRPQDDQGYDSDGAVDEDMERQMELADQQFERGPETSRRPTKALRKPRRAMLQTRSLPGTAFALGNSKHANDVIMNKVEEEDDWSAGNFAPQGFEPIQHAWSEFDIPTSQLPSTLSTSNDIS